jgi:hypothetical protein
MLTYFEEPKQDQTYSGIYAYVLMT